MARMIIKRIAAVGKPTTAKGYRAGVGAWCAIIE